MSPTSKPPDGTSPTSNPPDGIGPTSEAAMQFRELPLQELRDLAESVVTVAAAAEAGIFEALHTRPAAPDELARRLDLDARATAVALPVLEELGLLERDGEAGPYRLSERGRRELGDPASPGCQAGGLPLWLENVRAFSRLAESLRSGRPIDQAGAGDEGDDEAGDEDEEERRDGIARFMAGMAAAPEERVRRLVDGVLARRPGARSVLDLGGGPGHIARAFARRGPEVVLLDRPEIVDFVTQEYALDGVEGLRTVGGDFLTDALPEGPFDVVLLSNILHMLSPGECRGLLRRARGTERTIERGHTARGTALAPGGPAR